MNIATRLLPCLLPGLLLAACASPPAPAERETFGERARAAFARQAIVSATPSGAAIGIDGAAALQTQLAYRKSFAEPAPPAPPLVVSVGGRP